MEIQNGNLGVNYTGKSGLDKGSLEIHITHWYYYMELGGSHSIFMNCDIVYIAGVDDGECQLA